MDINIDLSQIKKVITPKFYPLLFDKNRFQCIYGSAGSGKSVYACQSLLLRILVGYTTDITHRILILRKTANSIRDSVFEEFKKWINTWNLNELVTINKSSMSFEFTNGSQIISAGLDDSEKLKSLTGVTSIWIEEASQITLPDFRQVNLRLRGITHTKMQIILTFNPISSLLWINDYFFANNKDNATIHHSTWRDNPYLNAEYINELKALKDQDENYWNIYSEGKFGILKDLVYNNYEILKEFPKKFKEVSWGMDFGFRDPSTLVQIGYYDNNYYIKERLYERNLTNTDLIECVKKIIPKKHRRKQIIYADNAEPARIEEFNRAGFICKPADKSVKDGIDFCRRSSLKLYSGSSNLIKEVQSYKHKETKDGTVLEEVVKFNDHTMDAMRYCMYSHWGKIRPKAEISFI